MHKRIASLCLLLLTVSTITTGCWSKREIESRGFATLVAIDKAENGDIEITASLAMTEAAGGEGGGGGSDAPAWTISASGKNVAEALASLQTFSGLLPFWFHAEAVVLGETLAKDGIGQVLDYALRNRDFRLTTWVLVAEGKAKDVLQLSPKITKLPSRYVRDLINFADEGSVARPQRLLDVIRKLMSDHGTEVYIPLIHAKPKEPSEGTKGTGGGGVSVGAEQAAAGGGAEEKPEAVMLEGTAVFLGDKMVGELNGTETRGMLWLRGETRRATVVVNTMDGYVVQRQIFARRKLKVTRMGNQLLATITVFQDGDVQEHSLPHVELNAVALKEMDAALVATIKMEAEAALRKLQEEMKSDTLGIGSRVFQLYPALFKSADWRQVFPELQVEVVVHANFRRPGEALESPLGQEKSNR